MNSFQRGLARHLGGDWVKFAASVPIGIIGAGGLGSNCAMHLLRSGFSRLILADPDIVEASNLNRQFFTLDQIGRTKVEALRHNLLAVNPDAEITTHPLAVDAANMRDLFGSCRAVVEAVDRPDTKKLILETLMPTGCLLVGASGMGGAGLAGTMSLRKLGANCVIVGDQITACSAAAPPLSPGVGMAAAMQADVILNYFLTKLQEA